MSELQGLVDTVVAQASGLPDTDTLTGWNPPLSGDIPIRILRDGRWEHDGGIIAREGLVRCFASLLRREEDGQYYLVTPVEKWRITVDRHALMVIDCEQTDDLLPTWQASLNTGGCCRIGGPFRLNGCGEDGEPYLEIPSGLSAQFTRAAWYRLVDAAHDEDGAVVIISAGERISLGSL